MVRKSINIIPCVRFGSWFSDLQDSNHSFQPFSILSSSYYIPARPYFAPLPLVLPLGFYDEDPDYFFCSAGPADKLGLVVCPHGGPHSASPDLFRRDIWFFNQLGLAVLLVNYRGSTGFGEKSLHSLPGTRPERLPAIPGVVNLKSSSSCSKTRLAR